MRSTPTGPARATVDVKNSDNRDWEDIALTGHRLWLADIGDNHAERDSSRCTGSPSPKLSASVTVTARLLTLRYDDRVARNAEAMVVDAARKKLFIFTKGIGDLDRVPSIGRPPARRRVGDAASGRDRCRSNQVTAADLGPRASS